MTKADIEYCYQCRHSRYVENMSARQTGFSRANRVLLYCACFGLYKEKDSRTEWYIEPFQCPYAAPYQHTPQELDIMRQRGIIE